jgi:hypothetical protein
MESEGWKVTAAVRKGLVRDFVVAPGEHQLASLSARAPLDFALQSPHEAVAAV